MISQKGASRFNKHFSILKLRPTLSRKQKKWEWNEYKDSAKDIILYAIQKQYQTIRMSIVSNSS